jgi:murein DD-endopeptidase MepM/ murein hydrolase activator NlpD
MSAQDGPHDGPRTDALTGTLNVALARVAARAPALACALAGLSGVPGLPGVEPAAAQRATGGTLGPAPLDVVSAQALSGGTQAPAAPLAGGSEYGISVRLPRASPRPARPSRRHSSHSRRPAHRPSALPKPKPKPKPKPPLAPAAPVAPTPPAVAPAPAPVAGVPTPQQSAVGAVFPVQGAHSYGDAANRFGAGRAGHIHQGQDVLAAEGTPLVAPLAGTIATTSYQAGGAGYYVVEHAADGFDLMFAHCQASSLAVSPGEAVSAGQALCRVGQTGDATGPHLHIEMWVGGWQAPGGQPIDPLPYLQAWE